MPFKRMQAGKYPPRLWGLVGFPGSGKSTLAARMREPILAVDADHRFEEVIHLAKEVYALSEVPEDNTNADRIAEILGKHMPMANVGTIVVDSLTAIITPLVVQALVDKQEGREKNLYAAWRAKALAMRQLQDAVTRWGTDVLWIYHLQNARDAQGNALTKATVSATELVRLTRSINMQLEIVVTAGGGESKVRHPESDVSRRGVKVVWARRGRSGLTLWDETEDWRGMPERIEAAVYDGLTKEEMEKIESAPPEAFPNPETAVAWAIEQGAFDEIPHARSAYEMVKREHSPKDARSMAAVWVVEVKRRVEERGAEGAVGEGSGGGAKGE